MTFMKLHLCVADLTLGTLDITSNTKTAINTVGGRASFKERPRIEVTRASTRGMCQMCVYGVFRLVDGGSIKGWAPPESFLAESGG